MSCGWHFKREKRLAELRAAGGAPPFQTHRPRNPEGLRRRESCFPMKEKGYWKGVLGEPKAAFPEEGSEASVGNAPLSVKAFLFPLE